MSRTLEQKIADAEARLQRLKAKSRSLDTAQKVIVGAALWERHCWQRSGSLGKHNYEPGCFIS